MREPLEDTQLAFYAALVGDEQRGASRRATSPSTAPAARCRSRSRVAEDARTLVVGIADEMRRLRAGAGLRALGEGSACDYCQARGLCRRDHWGRPDDGA